MKELSKSVSKYPYDSEIVGLVPAAGKAARISPLPCSKELLPIGFQSMKGTSRLRPKVVCQYLLDKFQLAGVSKTYIVLGKGKWDIPAYFGHDEFVDMDLAYLVVHKTCGPPFSLDLAYPFVRDKLVAFGFPDIIISPGDIFGPLLDQLTTKHADLVLAVFPAHDPQIMDMVEIDENAKINAMILKPGNTNLHLCWLCAVWSPVFTQFMHEYLEGYQGSDGLRLANNDVLTGEDLSVGAIIQAAIIKGLKVYGVTFPDGKYIDIGTPDNLLKSVELYGHSSS